MKTYIFSAVFLCLAFFAMAQNDDTKIVIISGDQTLFADDVEITIKKDGKKIKVNPDDIEIITNSTKSFNLNFNDIGGLDNMMGMNFRNLQSQMQRMIEQMDGFGGLDGMNIPQFRLRSEDGMNNIDDFDKKFDELNSDDSETNQLQLGNGNHTYTFKSDDGRTIVKEESIEIENYDDSDDFPSVELNEDNFPNYAPDKRPLVFLNGEQYDGDLNDIDQSKIYSMQVEKGTQVAKKFGDKGKNGVVYIKTRN